ncbi:hypothetical protein K493DRAFT_313259 [Basidiobolus meristosporus CBS 931.73]|uniref:Cyclin N-terminal domain-containing protein n=1 Tax=Basidiobolus meristosporus CBS 931.73 TaxID=1314790 RepID=A0A1Y1YP03_9FUNG|nr:hypothetical protein K493DRAFT_313259 [Basidiobolus meristosporus CBS 931.73]|eukprot:ORX99314.1 hypothetical protein K493DRAFT_313259 [Basidiobolus meristosporus CBS 931.73]
MKRAETLRIGLACTPVNSKTVRSITDVTILLIQAILQATSSKTSDENSLRAFIFRMIRCSSLTLSHLLCASIYLLRLNQTRPTVSIMHNGKQLFLSALILSHKFLDDTTKSTRFWSRCSGLPIPEIIQIEWEMFRLLEFNLNVSSIAFEKWAALMTA